MGCCAPNSDREPHESDTVPNKPVSSPSRSTSRHESSQGTLDSTSMVGATSQPTSGEKPSLLPFSPIESDITVQSSTGPTATTGTVAILLFPSDVLTLNLDQSSPIQAQQSSLHVPGHGLTPAAFDTKDKTFSQEPLASNSGSNSPVASFSPDKTAQPQVKANGTGYGPPGFARPARKSASIVTRKPSTDSLDIQRLEKSSASSKIVPELTPRDPTPAFINPRGPSLSHLSPRTAQPQYEPPYAATSQYTYGYPYHPGSYNSAYMNYSPRMNNSVGNSSSFAGFQGYGSYGKSYSSPPTLWSQSPAPIQQVTETSEAEKIGNLTSTTLSTSPPKLSTSHTTLPQSIRREHIPIASAAPNAVSASVAPLPDPHTPAKLVNPRSGTRRQTQPAARKQNIKKTSKVQFHVKRRRVNEAKDTDGGEAAFSLYWKAKEDEMDRWLAQRGYEGKQAREKSGYSDACHEYLDQWEKEVKEETARNEREKNNYTGKGKV